MEARPIARLPRSSNAALEIPGSFMSTQNALTPRAPGPPVRASTTARSAAMPSVIEVFSPCRVQAPAPRRLVVGLVVRREHLLGPTPKLATEDLFVLVESVMHDRPLSVRRGRQARAFRAARCSPRPRREP